MLLSLVYGEGEKRMEVTRYGRKIQASLGIDCKLADATAGKEDKDMTGKTR
jgi:hypothetical protein